MMVYFVWVFVSDIVSGFLLLLKDVCRGEILFCFFEACRKNQVNFKTLNKSCAGIVLQCTVIQSPIVCSQHFRSHPEEATALKIFAIAVNELHPSRLYRGTSRPETERAHRLNKGHLLLIKLY